MKIREEVQTLKPYYIEELQVKIKLDANESPYELPQEEKEELIKQLTAISLNRYPDPQGKTLKELLAKKEKIVPEQIILGNGSDEIINMILMIFKEGAKVMFPAPGFAMYAISSKILGKTLLPYALKEPYYEVDEELFFQILTENEPELVFIANPNNPTGNLFPPETLEKALEQFKDTIFVSDEAYFPYSQQTMIDKLSKYKNLLIMRSLSKIGFASIRLGYLMGDKTVIQAINKVRLPYNINTLTQKIAEYITKKNDLITQWISDTIEERERLYKTLTALNIFTLPSKGNFITFKIEKSGFYNYLLENGIIVKDLSQSFGMKNFYRVTVGKKEENDYFIKLLNKFIEGC